MTEPGPADRPALVRFERLGVRFRLRRGIAAALSRRPSVLKAVEDVSFELREGEVFGLVGESGSGKTTIAKALLRLHEPQTGRILFRDRDITHLPESQLKGVRRELQMVFQDPLSSLNPRHTVRRVLATPLLRHRLCQPEELEERIDALLGRVGLSPAFKDHFPHEMSGGQLQRVAISRALALHPALVVADEAVSKLDVSVRAQILNLFRDLQRELGMTMLFITHDLRVARYLCHRIGVMYFGRLVEVAPTAALFTEPRHPYTEALLQTIAPEGGGLETEPGLAGEAFNPVGDTTGCRFYGRCPIRTPACAERHPPVTTIAPDHGVACYERG